MSRKITNIKERSQNSTSYMYMVYWGVHIPNLLEYITHECLAKHYVLFATFVFVYSMELKFLANSLQKCLLLLFSTYDDVVRTIFQCRIFTKFSRMIIIRQSEATISSIYFCSFSVATLLRNILFLSCGSVGSFHLQSKSKFGFHFHFPTDMKSVLFFRLDASKNPLVVVGRWLLLRLLSNGKLKSSIS